MHVFVGADVPRLQPERADRTIAWAYSLRGGNPIGPVSAPVSWDEWPDLRIEDFAISTMPARFAEIGDLHAAIDDVHSSLEPLPE